MELTAAAAPRKKVAQKIPDSLIFEWVDGKPIYYKGYREALKNKQNIEAAMSESTLQIWLKNRLYLLLFNALAAKGYEIAAGELGIQFEKGKTRGADVAVYRAENFPLTKHFIATPPELVIEVDIKADLDDQKEMDYITRKLNDYIGFGVKKIIWIFTSSQQILIATPTRPWLLVDWNSTIETIEGATFNVGEMLSGRYQP